MADLNFIILHNRRGSGDSLSVDECAIGAGQVPHDELALLDADTGVLVGDPIIVEHNVVGGSPPEVSHLWIQVVDVAYPGTLFDDEPAEEPRW